jgi:hypothetical protein
MGFEIADWASVRTIEALSGQGAEFDRIVAFCREAIERTALAGQESERIYVSGRLAALLIGRGQLNGGLEVYGRIWPGSITPAVYGLQYAKLLLRVGNQELATQVIQEMEARLTEERVEPGRTQPPYLEELAVLFGRGLLALARDDREPLERICAELTELGQHINWVPYVDTGLLEGLVSAQEYELARRVLDFTAKVRPRQKG